MQLVLGRLGVSALQVGEARAIYPGLGGEQRRRDFSGDSFGS